MKAELTHTTKLLVLIRVSIRESGVRTYNVMHNPRHCILTKSNNCKGNLFLNINRGLDNRLLKFDTQILLDQLTLTFNDFLTPIP